MMKKKTISFFSKITNLGSFRLFIYAIIISVLLTGSFFYLLIYFPDFLIKSNTGDFILDLTFIGLLYVLSGLIPSFLILIIVYRVIRLLYVSLIRLLYLVIDLINYKVFNNTNYNKTKKIIKKMKIDKKNDFNIFWIAPIVVLVIGVLPLPIGYYNLSRLVVCVCALYFANTFYKSKDITNLWIFGFIAILYNPILPIYLYEKFIWIIVNLITIFLFYKNKDKIIK